VKRGVVDVGKAYEYGRGVSGDTVCCRGKGMAYLTIRYALDGLQETSTRVPVAAPPESESEVPVASSHCGSAEMGRAEEGKAI
jgi:hypothetical protein